MTKQTDAAPTVRAAIYARVSSEGQSPRSTADQVAVCQQYIARRGWPPAAPGAIFQDEAQSGGTVHRSAYQRLLGAIASSNGTCPFTVIVLEDFSRLTRDLEETGRLQKMAPLWGIEVIDVSSGRDITDDAAAYDAIGNARYLRDLHRRIRRGLSARFADGYHAGGSVYGFTTVPVPHPSGRLDRAGHPMLLGHRLEVNKAEAAVVRRIYAEAAAGMTQREIAAGLDRDHVPKPCARYTMVQGAARQRSQWNPGTVHSILRNPRYRGQWVYQRRLGVGRHPETGRKVLRAAPEGETQTRQGPRLIDDKLWYRVQTVLDARAAGVKHQPDGRWAGREPGCGTGRMFGRRIHPLIGLVRCAVCDGPMVIHKTRVTAHGTVRYLACNDQHRFTGHCTNVGRANLVEVERVLHEALTDHFSDAKLAAAHYKRFLAEVNAESRRRVASVSAVQKDLAQAERDLVRIQTAILRGLDTETTRQMILEAEARRDRAQVMLEEIRRDLKPALLPPMEILKGLNSQYYQDRKAAYRRLLSKVTLRSHRAPGKRRVEFWTVAITPKPEARMTGLPTRLTFGKAGVTVGHCSDRECDAKHPG